MQVCCNVRKVTATIQVVRLIDSHFRMEVHCFLRKVTAALHVVMLIKYIKNLSNYFLKSSQPILPKSVTEGKNFFQKKKKKKLLVPRGIEPKTSVSKQPFNNQRQMYFGDTGLKTYL